MEFGSLGRWHPFPQRAGPTGHRLLFPDQGHCAASAQCHRRFQAFWSKPEDLTAARKDRNGPSGFNRRGPCPRSLPARMLPDGRSGRAPRVCGKRAAPGFRISRAASRLASRRSSEHGGLPCGHGGPRAMSSRIAVGQREEPVGSDRVQTVPLNRKGRRYQRPRRWCAEIPPIFPALTSENTGGDLENSEQPSLPGFLKYGCPLRSLRTLLRKSPPPSPPPRWGGRGGGGFSSVVVTVD